VRLINTLNAQLNPICHLLALLGAHHILHVSRIRVKHTETVPFIVQLSIPFTIHNLIFVLFTKPCHTFRRSMCHHQGEIFITSQNPLLVARLLLWFSEMCHNLGFVQGRLYGVVCTGSFYMVVCIGYFVQGILYRVVCTG